MSFLIGNTWDKDVMSGLYCLGCGPQEEFYNCADVSIKPKKIAETPKSSNRKQSNSNRLSQMKSKEKAPNSREKSGKQRLNMAATSTALTERHPERKMVTRTWDSQSEVNKKRQGWLLVGRNNFSRINGHVRKSSQNPRKENIKITMTTKRRGDIPLDSVDLTTRERQTQNKLATNSNSKTSTKSTLVSTSKSIWQWWFNRISSPVKDSHRLKEKPLLNTQQRLVTRLKTTSTPRFTNKTPATKTTAVTKRPCYAKKNPNKNKRKSVISPVQSYHLGWWRRQSLQSSAHSITPMWTLKPVLKCKALISLSGGMDSWCFANCNANYCPSNICQCQKDLRYVPLYATDSFLEKKSYKPNQRRSLAQKAWTKTNALGVRTEESFRRNTRLSPIRRQYYSRSEAAKTFTCHAVGLYSRLVHFDDWCNRNCFLFMCPTFICQCSRRWQKICWPCREA